MAQNEINVNIDYLIENGLVNYADGDMVIMNSTTQPHIESTVKLEMVTVVYVESGLMQVDLNGKTVKAGAGDLIVCAPNTFVNNGMSTADYSSKVFGLSYKAIQRSLLMSKDVWGVLAFVTRNPVIHLTPESSVLIQKYYSLIKDKIENPHGYFHQEIMQSLFHCIFYEVAAVIAPQMGNLRHDGQFRQGEILFKKFIEHLSASDNTDRSVKAFAEKLCVTPKYLSTVCKSVSGKTALEWIHDYLANTITQKLKYTDVSIKEIADDLGFPNISFFGKFVKNRFGVSPKEYRQRLQAMSSKAEMSV